MNLSNRDHELLKLYAPHIAGAYGEDIARLLSADETEVARLAVFSREGRGTSILMRYHVLRGQLTLLRELDTAGLLLRPAPRGCPECGSTLWREAMIYRPGESAGPGRHCRTCNHIERDDEIPEHRPCPVCYGDHLLDYTESNEDEDNQHRVECMSCGTNAPAVAWDRRSEDPRVVDLTGRLENAVDLASKIADDNDVVTRAT